jgi:hypothetical protein
VAMFASSMLLVVHFACVTPPKSRRACTSSLVAPLSLWQYSVSLWGPALMNVAGTTCACLAFIYSYASIVQMLRGSLLVWMCVLTLIFFGNLLRLSQWIGVGVTLVGVVLIGVASITEGELEANEDSPNPQLGLFFAVGGQFLIACQVVWEQHVLLRYPELPGMVQTGLEGLEAFAISLLLLVIFYFLPGSSPGGRLENALDAGIQIGNNYKIGLFLAVSAVASAVFEYSGLTIVRETQAVTRAMSTLLSGLVVWIVAVSVGWERFIALQMVGYAVILIGFLCYADYIPLSQWVEAMQHRCCSAAAADEAASPPSSSCSPVDAAAPSISIFFSPADVLVWPSILHQSTLNPRHDDSDDDTDVHPPASHSVKDHSTQGNMDAADRETRTLLSASPDQA